MEKPDKKKMGDFLADVHLRAEEYGLVLDCGPEGLLVRPMTDDGSQRLLSAKLDEEAGWDDP